MNSIYYILWTVSHVISNVFGVVHCNHTLHTAASGITIITPRCVQDGTKICRKTIILYHCNCFSFSRGHSVIHYTLSCRRVIRIVYE